MEYYDFYWQSTIIASNQVRVPGTNEQAEAGYHVLTLSPDGFIRVGIDRDAGDTLATYVAWLESNGFVGKYAPEYIKRLTDIIWVTDLVQAYSFKVPAPPEGV